MQENYFLYVTGINLVLNKTAFTCGHSVHTKQRRHLQYHFIPFLLSHLEI